MVDEWDQDLLKLPPSHFVGVSMGSSISIHLATFHSHLVRSLFLISPLSAYEPEEVGQGRAEIWEVWQEGKEVNTRLLSLDKPFPTKINHTDLCLVCSHSLDEQRKDDEVVRQAAIGALQLGFNNVHGDFIDRCVSFHTAEFFCFYL